MFLIIPKRAFEVDGNRLIDPGGPPQAGQWINGLTPRCAKFKVKMRGRRFGVAAVPDPADHLTGNDPVTLLEAGGYATAQAVIGQVRVVVEMEVPGTPTVVVSNEDRNAGPVYPGDNTVADCQHRCQARGGQVDTLVIPFAAVPLGAKDREHPELTRHRQGHSVARGGSNAHRARP